VASGIYAQLIFLTLKMEAICSSETSVDTQRTTLRYIPEDGGRVHLEYLHKNGELIKMDLKEVGCGYMDWINLRIGANGRRL
jgi:hypothetical protein